jgi:hypothetical protein
MHLISNSLTFSPTRQGKQVIMVLDKDWIKVSQRKGSDIVYLSNIPDNKTLVQYSIYLYNVQATG